MTFTPSSEQQDIYSAMLASNLLVSACPGSGKSTTIFHAFKRIPLGTGFIPPRIVYVVFSKASQLHAVEKCKALDIRNVEITTCHSLGFRALKDSKAVPYNVKISGSFDYKTRKKIPDKVATLVWNALGFDHPDSRNVIKLVSLLKSVWNSGREADVELARALCDRHEIDLTDPDKSTRTAVGVLQRSDADLSVIDYDDMLRLGLVLNIPFAKADWVFVDEAQDTNEVQSEILWRLIKKTTLSGVRAGIGHQLPCPKEGNSFDWGSCTRFVFVGDPSQAIYGFRGADSDAMDKLAQRFGCKTLPLSVSYRCPQAVVREAQKYT